MTAVLFNRLIRPIEAVAFVSVVTHEPVLHLPGAICGLIYVVSTIAVSNAGDNVAGMSLNGLKKLMTFAAGVSRGERHPCLSGIPAMPLHEPHGGTPDRQLDNDTVGRS
jgi:hypothetical protein